MLLLRRRLLRERRRRHRLKLQTITTVSNNFPSNKNTCLHKSRGPEGHCTGWLARVCVCVCVCVCVRLVHTQDRRRWDFRPSRRITWREREPISSTKGLCAHLSERRRRLLLLRLGRRLQDLLVELLLLLLQNELPLVLADWLLRVRLATLDGR